MKKKPLIILTGPTAVGKTALSIRLAREIHGEIISADSMQVYRHMDIGSAKIKPQEMQGVPHHMIDILEPCENFNVYMFQKRAKECLEEIYQRSRIPLVVGGTGFYIQALLYDIEFEKEDEAIRHTEAEQNLQTQNEVRKRLEMLLDEKGSSYLHSLLEEVDPESAAEIHENNRKRMIRALEFYEKNHLPISRHNQEQRKKESAYNSCYFVLNDHRETLYERINRRVDLMLSQGLLEEVKRLREMGCHKEMVSMQGLGYKELLSSLDGECSYEEAVSRIKQDSRHFAKRQLTWFRRERDVIWLFKPDFSYDDDKILEYIMNIIQQKGLI